MEKRIKKKVLLIMSLIFILLIVVGAALVSSLAFRQNSIGDIRHSVRVEDGIPPSTATCNMTLFYPNRTVFVDFQAMTNQVDDFNYTLNESQTSVIGKYDYDITCFSGSLNKTDTFELFINPGGVEPSATKTDAISRAIYVIFTLGILLFISFLLTKENFVFKYTFFLLSLLFFLIAINFIFIGLQDDVVNPTVQDFFSSFTAISFILYWFFGFAIFTLWTVAIINTLIYKNNIKQAERMDQSLGW